MSYIKKIKCLIEQVNNIISFRPKLDYDPVTETLTGTFTNGKHASTPIQIPTFTCEDLENCQEIIDIKDAIPGRTSELINDSGYLACEDLENCQVIEIIQKNIEDVKDAIPIDVSELTDDSNLFFDGDYNSLTNTPTFKTVDGQSILGSGDISDPTFRISLTFEDVETDISTAGYTMKIVEVNLKTTGLTETVTVNGSSYTYGSTIHKGDRIEIDTNIVGFVIFNCEYI